MYCLECISYSGGMQVLVSLRIFLRRHFSTYFPIEMNTKRLDGLFHAPIRESVSNFLTGEECSIHSCEDVKKFTETDLVKICEMCNQPLIYDVLFKERLNGLPYSLQDASKFIQWAAEGWKCQQWFVFLIRRNQGLGEIIAAIDIKSPNLENGEIGYWADCNHHGIMTNAVRRICELAFRAGYRNLFACALPTNKRSQSLLIRSGFSSDGRQLEKPFGGTCMRFTRTLINNFK